jgi:c-di-GMP phosphodiesterase
MANIKNLLRLIAVICAAVVGAAGGWQAHLAYFERVEQRHLALEASRLLEKTELSIRDAANNLKRLEKRGFAACSPSVQAISRHLVLANANVKDVAAFGVSGTMTCRAGVSNLPLKAPAQFEQAGKDPKLLFGLPDGYPEGNLSVRLLATEAGQNPASPDHSSVAVNLGLDAGLSTVVGIEYRDAAAISIRLTGMHVLATYGEDRMIGTAGTDWVTEPSSEKYPIAVKLSVSQSRITLVASQNGVLTATLAGVAAALFAAAFILFFSRPPNPVNVLRAAIKDGEIVPFFQPIVALPSGDLTGCEILARWKKPDGKMIAPDKFIPLAEASGLIEPMTEALLLSAIRAVKPLLRRQPDLKLALNIAPAHFMKPGFVDGILAICAREALSPKNLVLELTERETLSDMNMAASIAADARAKGLRISVDDVGSGHNGLSTIQDLPGDIIKIDKRFIDTVVDNALSRSIIQMLTDLAHMLGRKVVAEGMESHGQVLAIVALGVDEAQGYFFAKPMNGADFAAHCENHAKRGDVVSAVPVAIAA